MFIRLLSDAKSLIWKTCMSFETENLVSSAEPPLYCLNISQFGGGLTDSVWNSLIGYVELNLFNT